jgi:hypothetical protein
MTKSRISARHLRRFFVCAIAAGLALGTARAETWKFAVMGDCRGARAGQGSKDGVRVSILEPLAEDAVKQGVRLVVFSGDLADGGFRSGRLTNQWKVWREAMAPLYSAGVPVYAVRGNHELQQDHPRGAAVKAWRSFFPELPQNGPPGQEGLSYSVVYSNATFVGFDQFVGRSKKFDTRKYDSSRNKGVAAPWVIEQVKNAKTKWVFAFAHESAFIGHHTDCMANAPAERDALWDALGEKGGVFLAGHDHYYTRRVAPDIANRPVLELIVGCSGAPQYTYDNFAKNAQLDRHAVAKELFVNAKMDIARGARKPAYLNNNSYPGYFGYAIITVEDDKLSGEWRAFTNYDLRKWKPAGKPKFESLDRFSWP